LQIITPDRQAAPREVSGHGTSTGYRIHRVGANRWELKRGKDGWKVTRRHAALRSTALAMRGLAAAGDCAINFRRKRTKAKQEREMPKAYCGDHRLA
jgi:hypothetical protein